MRPPQWAAATRSAATALIRHLLRKPASKPCPTGPTWVDGSGPLAPQPAHAAHLTAAAGARCTGRCPKLAPAEPAEPPAAGQGTLRKRYHDARPAQNDVVWGKTGTLTHTCNLAGYVRRKAAGCRWPSASFNNGIPATTSAPATPCSGYCRRGGAQRL
ncbi:MAG: D-alanyl-D-alanine carboxypeptidase [Hymenobacter sp.]